MVRFTGYAKKREPKWPYALIALIVVLIALVVLYIASAITSWLENEINKPPAAATSSTSTSTSSSTTVSVTSTTLAEEPVEEASVVPDEEGSGGIRLDQIVISSGVDESNQPVDDLPQISVNEYANVYCFTRLTCDAPPQTIRHVWLAPGGRVAAEIELTLRNRNAATWSYINIAGMKTGQWEVRVEKSDGTIIGRKSFSTY